MFSGAAVMDGSGGTGGTKYFYGRCVAVNVYSKHFLFPLLSSFFFVV